MTDFLFVVAIALVGMSFCYILLAIAGVLRFGRRLAVRAPTGDTQPVTILKPLCGMETDIAENLRSFCRQDYDAYQIVFGVRDRNDPVIPVVERIIAEFPALDIALVVDDRVIGTNYKISNLANMMAVAKYDILAISDSDMRVRADYLRRIAAPFADGTIGATTCLYSGTTRNGIASELGAMFVNDWFLPSALVPTMVGELQYCFGATMAVRRKILTKFGGFPALANYLADDYMLGHRVVSQGYKIALAPYVVENVIYEAGLKGLFLHELRWARTIRSVQPVGYALSFITDILPLSLIGAIPIYLATLSSAWALAVPGAALVLRVLLHLAVCRTAPPGTICAPWLIPLRDLFSVSVRVASFFGSKVLWRERSFVIHANNQIEAANGRLEGKDVECEKDAVPQSSHV